MEAALDGAMRVFRDRGFHEASVVELGTAMQLTAGSIYKAFSDKQEIFAAAFDRYRQLRDERLGRRLQALPTAREKIAETLRFYGELASGAEGRMGCLVVGAATDLSTLEPGLAGLVANAVERNEAFLAGLVRLGHGDGSIPQTVDPASTAMTLLCLTQGMRVVGKLGRTEQQMAAVVEQAMKILG